MKIHGIDYTQEQLVAAVDCAALLYAAYAAAASEDGGGGSVEWEQLDEAREIACKALPDSRRLEIDQCVQVYNKVYGPGDVR